jgi:uncharacterized protein DUF3800
VALHAYIDESGQIGASATSSDHFVMSATVCRESNAEHLEALLLRLRADLNRRPTDRLNWKKIKEREQRLLAAQLIGGTTFLRTVSVVVCKRHLHPPITNTHVAYLFTLRFLLERLSWLGRKHGTITNYTLSHVKHFRKENLRSYETKLRELGTATEIDWRYLDQYGGRISNDTTVEALQIADLVASATARAFEPNPSGPADPSYLRELAPRIYRGVPGRENVITSYGLKMHPWNVATRALYPWVAELA